MPTSSIRDERSPDADSQYHPPFHHAPAPYAQPIHNAPPIHHAPAPYASPVHHSPPVHHAPPVHHKPVHKEPARPYQYEYGVADQYSGAQFQEVQTQDAAGVVVGQTHLLQNVTYKSIS